MCVDYKDLKNVTPKDDFHLPYIDVLINNTSGQDMYSFLDRFSRYNQIMMDLKYKVKTSLVIEWETYNFKVMSFSLKNAGTTHQRMATILFHDMIHKEMEMYVDHIVVK